MADISNEICTSRPANEKFRKGWTNRLKELDFSENAGKAGENTGAEPGKAELFTAFFPEFVEMKIVIPI